MNIRQLTKSLARRQDLFAWQYVTKYDRPCTRRFTTTITRKDGTTHQVNHVTVYVPGNRMHNTDVVGATRIMREWRKAQIPTVVTE